MADSDIKIVGLSSSKSSGKTNWKIISAIIGIVVLSIGIIAGIVLVRQNQNINEDAKSLPYGRCSEGGEACPGADGVLRNCHPPEADDTAVLSLCNQAGRIEFCGTRNYCCPSAGGTWTPDMTACAVAPTITSSPRASATALATSTASAKASSTATSKATATATTKATATSTSKATATSKSTATATGTTKATSTAKTTATAKASATATAFPVPETGVSLPTMLGTGFGIIMILVSLALAL